MDEETSYMIKCHLLSVFINFLLITLDTWIKESCSDQMYVWFLVWNGYALIASVVYSIFYYRYMRNLWVYLMINYPLDLLWVGCFFYGLFVYSDLTSECIKECTISYYFMMLLLLLSMMTFVKYLIISLFAVLYIVFSRCFHLELPDRVQFYTPEEQF